MQQWWQLVISPATYMQDLHGSLHDMLQGLTAPESGTQLAPSSKSPLVWQEHNGGRQANCVQHGLQVSAPPHVCHSGTSFDTMS